MSRRYTDPLVIHHLFDDYGLDPYAFRVYAHIVRRAAHSKGRLYWASVANGAEVCRVSQAVFRRSLNTLVDLGILTRQERPGKTTCYRLEPSANWSTPLSETRGAPDAPLSETTGVPLSETTGEEEHIEEEHIKNLSSFDNDEDSKLEVFTEEEPSDSISEASSSVNPPPSSAAPPPDKWTLTTSSFLELLPAIAAAWNESCGELPKLTGGRVARSYHRNTLRFVKAALEDGIDPVKAVRVVAQVVSKIDWYLERGGFGNVIAGDNWRKHYDAGIRDYQEDAELKVGARFSWPLTPGRPWAGSITGTLSHMEEGFAVMKVDPGQRGVHFDTVRVNPKHLREEEDE